jgi:hypothetical protein
VVKTDVSPEEARVYMDGRYIGTADDFDGYPDFLYLKRGKYRLEFQLEGFETQSADIDAHGGGRVVLNNKLKKIPGAKQYGSYDTPEPQGGIQRFFAKGKDQTTDISVQPDGDEYGGSRSDWRDRQSGPPAEGDQEGPPQAPPPGKSYDDPAPSDRESGARQPAPPVDSKVTGSRVPGTKARLVFRIEPGDAAVYVDDRFAGTGEELSSLTRGLQVAPGMHKIVVSRPGFAPESTQVDASAGQSETVEVTLERR